MAAKVPIRAVFDGSTATGLAEFQSTEFIALAYGGLGVSLSLGSAGQLLKVNDADELTYFNLQRYMSPHFRKKDQVDFPSNLSKV